MANNLEQQRREDGTTRQAATKIGKRQFTTPVPPIPAAGDAANSPDTKIQLPPTAN
jgi:hypothetical protein